MRQHPKLCKAGSVPVGLTTVAFRNFCRVEELAPRRAHNAEFAGSSPAPATTLPVAGLVATPRRVEAVASLPAWSLLRINPKLISGGNHIAG